MPIGIIRFGGNSFSTPTHLNRLAEELKKTTAKQVVVVSAIPRIYQILHEGLNGIVQQTSDFNLLISAIKAEIKRIGIEDHEAVRKEIKQLESLLNGIQFTGDYSDSLRDTVLSFSEKIACQVLAQFLQQKQLSNQVIYPEELDLTVTEEFGNASVLLDDNKTISNYKFSSINLIPGSYGITKQQKIARLGAHASDYTAASLTRLLGAEKLELWEPGQTFRSADPNLANNSVIVSRLTYQEASELCYFSQSSLHPRIVEPLISQHIPIEIYRLTPDGKKLETTINSEQYISPQVVKSIVCDDEIAILQLNGPGVGFKPGILAKVTSEFHQSGINIRSVITSQVSINIILEKADAAKAQQICQQLPLSSVNEIQITDHISLIAVVGHGMQTHHSVSSQLFNAVSRVEVNVLLSGSGASDLLSYLVIDQKEKQKAVQEIHRVFTKPTSKKTDK